MRIIKSKLIEELHSKEIEKERSKYNNKKPKILMKTISKDHKDLMIIIK